MAGKQSSSMISLMLAMGIIFISTIPTVRQFVGAAMDLLLGPLLAPPYALPFYAIILILSALTGLYSSLLQKYTVDYERLTEVQGAMREFQKEYRDAQLSKDEKRVKKLDAKRDKMMKEQLELSQEQFKPMAYILLVSIPIFLWLIYKLPQITTNLPGLAQIVFPYFGSRALWNGTIWIVPAWILWYMICSICISQVIRKSMNIGGI
ncbi:MAG TPA: EMC3/TMCO1 family protein [Methanomicrobiales archaeon]|nr:EMC3/TMCO1 family protein [Methanomicrobiales archaeon]